MKTQSSRRSAESAAPCAAKSAAPGTAGSAVRRSSSGSSRIECASLRHKIMSAEDAAALIRPGAHVGLSGFTPAGYPKAVPAALAQRIEAAHRAGHPFQIGVWTGASTAPAVDSVLAQADAIAQRLPYQSDPVCRQKINSGAMEYLDLHLSHVAQIVREGFLGPLDVAMVEVAGITADGLLIPTTSVGNNQAWIDCASGVILEVNNAQDARLEGMHDIYHEAALPPYRRPIPITTPGDRIGTPYFSCPAAKILAVVETNAPDDYIDFAAPDQTSQRIAGHLLDFLTHEVGRGRLPAALLPLQSGAGNIANAVLLGMADAPFTRLTAYTEVIQDGMLHLLRSGKLQVASTTALSLSAQGMHALESEMATLKSRIIMRPLEISNHPEVIRRLGCLAMNGMIEADIYSNVNSTHVAGTRIQNGIGGSGDFARNSYLSFFMTPSTAKSGAISCIVPMVSHVDHTEHDVDIIVTEQGLADLRGLSPKQRAREIIARCAHPSYRAALEDYYERALALSAGKQTPHLLDEALSWHACYLETGSMQGVREGTSICAKRVA